ncbi:putative nuclease HARBI1 [Pseudophryne corroboree]|uniref:putative nuclease HARBI1 n=1 Tax=Pseudophryne corroboree TaxID=495146 RepID=UPI00308195B3
MTLTLASLMSTQVLDVLEPHINASICFPTEESEWSAVRVAFYELAGMPNVLGAIDCTHVQLRSPKGRQYIYTNRHLSQSTNVQVVCDANLKIMSVVAGYPGGCHDSFILSQSSLFDKFEAGEMPDGWLLGDGGYGCYSWLLTPLSQPDSPAEHSYNHAHKATRNVIERCFGVLKSRFRCLDKSAGLLLYSPSKITEGIGAHHSANSPIVPVVAGVTLPKVVAWVGMMEPQIPSQDAVSYLASWNM